MDISSSSPISPSSQFASDGSSDGSGDGTIPSDNGSVVGSDEETDILEMSEPLQRYYKGLYYPICIGDVLDGSRYRVIHKLGWGGFSTVWMAHDTQHHSVVALKISIPGDMGSREAKMNREIMAAVRDTSRLLTMLDTFTLAGVNGATHLVLVYPVRGPSMTMQIYMKQSIPVRKRMAAARPLLLAIQSLHDANMVHCDLNSGSVLWDVGDVSQHTRETIYEHFGRPRRAPPWTDMWKKGEMVKPAQVRDLELLRPSVFLCDFGLAMKSGCSVRCRWQSPACYCAPERFHGQGPSFASDMWSYMCLFAELYLGLVPFHGHSNHAAVTSFVCSLGPLPSAWEGAYDAGSSSSPEELWYDQTQGVDAIRSLQEITRRARPDASEEERELALKVFTKVFCYVPEDRLTAAELLADPDFDALLQITATQD